MTSRFDECKILRRHNDENGFYYDQNDNYRHDYRDTTWQRCNTEEDDKRNNHDHEPDNKNNNESIFSSYFSCSSFLFFLLFFRSRSRSTAPLDTILQLTKTHHHILIWKGTHHQLLVFCLHHDAIHTHFHIIDYPTGCRTLRQHVSSLFKSGFILTTHWIFAASSVTTPTSAATTVVSLSEAVCNDLYNNYASTAARKNVFWLSFSLGLDHEWMLPELWSAEWDSILESRHYTVFLTNFVTH